MRLSFGSVQIGGIMAVLLVTFAVAGTSAFVYAHLAVSDLGAQVIEQTSDRIDLRVHQALDLAATQAQVDKNLLVTGQIDPDDFQALSSYFMQALKAEKGLSYLSWSTAKGEYVDAERSQAGKLEFQERRRMPDGRLDLLQLALMPDGSRTVVKHVPNSHFDPRPRPYYVWAKDAGKPVWTESYMFLDTNARPEEAGITRAVPVYLHGALSGVLTADFNLKALSEFLRKVPVGKHGFAFLVERRKDGSERVVAHPDPNLLRDTTKAHPELLDSIPASQVADPLVRAFAPHLPTGPGKAEGLVPVRFVQDGVRYLGAYRWVTGKDVPNWMICTILPAADVMGRVNQMDRTSTAIALVGLLLALALGIYLSRTIAGRVRDLETEMQRISHFELTDHRFADHPSFIREMHDMGVAADAMKQSLRSFGRYVPQELVRTLLEDGREARLGAESRELTILFNDIEGFTTLVESTPPDVVLEVLGTYLEAMNEEILSTEGTVCQYLGDAIMAFWGAPRSQADHALRACRGGLAMRRRLVRINAAARAAGRPELRTRFGINSGEVLVGNIGAPQRFNYGALGDAVNTASRLEGLNKEYGTPMLVGEHTAALVGDALVLRPVDWVRMKGKALPMLVYELIGEPGEVEDATLEAIEHYRAGLQAYRQRAFDAAITAFQAANEAWGGQDGPCEVMIRRCTHYLHAAPAADWDGVFTMTTK